MIWIHICIVPALDASMVAIHGFQYLIFASDKFPEKPYDLKQKEVHFELARQKFGDMFFFL